MKSVYKSRFFTRIAVSLLLLSGSLAAKADHFSPVDPSGRTQPVYITDATLDGVQLQAGDEVGVFDGSLCVGSAVISNLPMIDPIVVYLQYSAPGETPKPGAKDGNSMSFKVWDQSAGRQESADIAQVLTGLAVFSEGSIVALKLSAGIEPVEVDITITTSPAGRTFSVDGTAYSSAQTFTWLEGSTHQISVTSPQNVGAGTRYVYTSWSDGGAQSHTYMVPGADQTVTANFKTQYELTVNSTHGSPTGAGWYDAGASATFGVTTPASGGAGTRYVLTGWTGTGPGSYTGSSASSSVTMNGPITEEASWKTQYELTVNSAHGSPTGAGWYDAGSGAAFGVTTPSAGGTGTRYVLTGWTGTGSGSYTGSSASSTVTMNNPITEDAAWKTQYYLTTAENPDAGGNMTPAPPGGWYDSGTVVSLDATVNAPYQWTGWSGDLSGTTKPSTVTMSAPKSVTANFRKEVDITVTTSPAGRTFSVDGTTYSSVQTFTWVEGSTHEISVTSPQNVGAGTRYVYTSWSDGGAQSQTYTVPGSDQTVTANLKTQHQLTVNSAHGSPTGAGWYDTGTNASFSVTSPDVQGGTRYVFTGWSEDYTGSTPSSSITMNAPKTITANWSTQYYLTVNSAHGSPTGADWYDAGASADFSVSSPDQQGGTRYVFQNWSGDFSGSNPSGSVTMNNPKSVTAHWGTQHYLYLSKNPDDGGDMAPTPPGGWYNAGSVVTLTATPNAGENFVFGGWSGDVTGTANPTAITMNTSKTVTANFTLLGQIRITTNPAGLTVTVDGTEYTAPRDFEWLPGSTHTIGVTSPQAGESGTRYVYQSWSDGGGRTHEITVDGISVYTANFQTQYYLSTAENPDSRGDMTPAPPGEWYAEGTEVSLVAMPAVASGYFFSGWGGDQAGSENPAVIAMNGPKSVVANFGLGSYSLTTTIDPSGTGNVSISPEKDTYTHGETVTLTPIPESGYMFDHWSGDASGSGHPVEILMDSDKEVTAHFKREDLLPPKLVHVYPAPGSVYIPRNTEIQFMVIDQGNGYGVDRATLDVSVNGTPLLTDGVDQTGGRISFVSHSPKYTIHYNPMPAFPAGDTVEVHVHCRDLASPSNSMDSTFLFMTSHGSKKITERDTLDQAGGTVACDSTGIRLIIPANALADTTQIVIGTSEDYPSLPDNVTGVGLPYHFWPNGLQFPDSVSVLLEIPYTRSDLDSAGVTDPNDLSVYHFSTSKGEWKKLEIVRVDTTGHSITLRLKEFCYVIYGRTTIDSGVLEKEIAAAVPGDFKLMQNYPNPFNPETVIAYQIPKTSNVRISIYNTMGQKIRTLVDDSRNAGYHQVVWDGSDDLDRKVSSGIYIMRMRAGDYSAVKKISFIQ